MYELAERLRYPLILLSIGISLAGQGHVGTFVWALGMFGLGIHAGRTGSL